MNVAPASWCFVLMGQQQTAAELLADSGRSGGANLVTSPLLGAAVTGIAALILLLPRATRASRRVGAVLGMLSLLLLFGGVMVPLAGMSSQIVFWALAAVTIVSAVAAVATPSPIYTAIWFALSLLGTAGLLLYQGAQFLSVATVAVYAGAIVVTFLFVLMLAQPEGHEVYDRVSWGWYTKPMSAVVAALLVALLSFSLPAMPGPAARMGDRADQVLHPDHMARFGDTLFGKHLLSMEIAGALLLVALVGAVAIMIQAGHLRAERAEGQSDE